MVAAASPGTVGEILAGKYRIEAVIGVGGMGRVVKANHLYLHQPVAIKILLPQMVESQSTVARFLREAQSTVKLRSEHIARVIDVGTMSDNTPFIVMEFLEGFDLNQILRHHGPQMAQPVVDLILQACEGIAEAHSVGIIHRDIKPSNFFITRRPDGSNLLKILDFGISKTPAELTELTGTQTVVGTPTYMAPEQMRTARSTDPRSDIWSMGVVMYQMLAGRPPFEAETYAELVMKVGLEPPTPLHVPLPAGLDSIVLRCLEKDPKNRIQTVGELARMIAPYASDPLSAQQSAERSTRILTGNARNSNLSLSSVSVGSGGMGLTPAPAMTPKSWHHTGGSSVGGAAGQMGTKVTRSSRSLVIAGVATLIVAAGAGGFVIANNMGKSEISHVGAPNPLEATMSNDKSADKPDPVPVKAADTAPTVDGVVKPDLGTAVGTAIKSDVPKTATTKVDATKSTAATKTDTTKSVAKTTPKTDTKSTKSTTIKSTTKTKPKDDGLFDDRH
ncbi:MAG TPA: serine/threonine-protein kinase [Kofleriaceae bacterium]